MMKCYYKRRFLASVEVLPGLQVPANVPMSCVVEADEVSEKTNGIGSKETLPDPVLRIL